MKHLERDYTMKQQRNTKKYWQTGPIRKYWKKDGTMKWKRHMRRKRKKA